MPTPILLIEDNPIDATVATTTLAGARARAPRDGAMESHEFLIEHVTTLAAGLARLQAGGFDAVLLDLMLPDSDGLETLERVRTTAPEVPVVVLAGAERDDWGVTAVQQGAQDFLLKGHVEGPLLIRSLRYAIERHRVQMALRALCVTDELTGLYNRRGFLALADQQLRLLNRTRHGALLFYLDVDRFKSINDTFGHPAGDEALAGLANVLRDAFRTSDLIARMGGDEFVVLATASREDAESMIRRRLAERLQRFNSNREYEISVSVGVRQVHVDDASSVAEIISDADRAMLDEKRGRHASRRAAAIMH